MRGTIVNWLQHRDTSRSLVQLKLEQLEWEHVKYLIILLKPYYTWTEALSKTSGVTIHKAWTCYNALFDHLDKEKR